MAISRPFNNDFFVPEGIVAKSGEGSLQLSTSKVGIYHMETVTPNGATSVETFLGKFNPRKDTFEIKRGSGVKNTNTRYAASYSTFPFKLEDVVEVKATVPQRKEMQVDELLVGYNGQDAKTSLQLKAGEQKELYVELESKIFRYFNMPDGKVQFNVPIYADAPYSDICANSELVCTGSVDMYPIINRAVQYIKDLKFPGIDINDYIEVTPIIESPATIKRTGEKTVRVARLTVTDEGDANALAVVQALTPDFKVVRQSRHGLTSVYEVMGEGVSRLTSIVLPKALFSMSNCGVCSEGTITEAGFSYTLRGTTLPATLPAGGPTLTKVSNDYDVSVGVKEAVYTSPTKLNLTNLEAVKSYFPKFIGKVNASCLLDVSENEYTWEQTTTTYTYSSEDYTITLPDGECGESRLQELKQAYYPNEVTEVSGSVKNCGRKYGIKMETNVVMPQCSVVFQDLFTSEAPKKYNNVDWVKSTSDVVTDPSNSYYGIRFKAKKILLSADEALRDFVGFMEDSVRIKVSGGYITDDNLVTTNMGQLIVDKPFTVTYVSYYAPRDNVAGNFYNRERMANTHFTGELPREYDYMGRILTGQTSVITDPNIQIVDFAVTLRRNKYAQGFSSRHEETITYHIITEYGKHTEVEKLLTNLAEAAGVEPPFVEKIKNLI